MKLNFLSKQTTIRLSHDNALNLFFLLVAKTNSYQIPKKIEIRLKNWA